MDASLKFEWGEAKRLANLRKHGVDFVDAARLFRGPLITSLDGRFDYGEPRFVAVRLLDDRVVIAAYTESRNAIRIISMRKANRYEETQFLEKLAD